MGDSVKVETTQDTWLHFIDIMVYGYDDKYIHVPVTE